VEKRDVPVQLTGIGNAEAFQMVQVRSQVNGQINSVHFKEGQDVRKGQLLFTLDKRPFEAEVERAIGTMQRDEAQAANSAAQAARFNALEQQGVIAHQLADQQRAQAKADAPVELRNAVRFPLQIPLRLFTATGEIAAMTENISATGVAFTLPRPLEVQTQVRFTMKMPADGEVP